MSRTAIVATGWLLVLNLHFAPAAERSRYAKTYSDSQYVHWILLYDADNRKIDPTDPDAKPYSPMRTCGRCHDYRAIVTGHHFNAFNATDPAADAGRPGEPWIWTDDRTGTQIPLSYRRWKGTYDPLDLDITAREFLLKFGRHFPGGGAGESGLTATTERPAENGGAEEKPERPDRIVRWRVSGLLDVDCMVCHCDDFTYSGQARWKEIEAENFAWAPTAALGIGYVKGMVSRLPDDFDPDAVEPNSRYKLPQTTYAPLPTNGEGRVFFDIIRKPHSNSCYYCHSQRPVGAGAGVEWNHDEDVHLKAGMACADCHRNGIEHHMVRGYAGEQHPTGESVASLSCRGCHLGDEVAAGGRLGAPLPLHKGLPPLHLEKLSCTACHSGPLPGEQAQQVQTAMAHGLGLPSHHYGPHNVPHLVAPVFQLSGDETLYPFRVVWPAFWGVMQGDKVTPFHPEAVYNAARRTLRVRRGDSFSQTMATVRLSNEEKTTLLGAERSQIAEEELTVEEQAKLTELQRQRALENWQAKLAEVLTLLKELTPQADAQPIYVSAGKAFKLSADGQVESFETDAAQPYSWPLAHNVRPVRQSLGASGCNECHAEGAAIFEGTVTALGPAPDQQPHQMAMYELAGYDKLKLDAWAQSFQGRTLFKYVGFASMGLVAVVLLAHLVAGVNGMSNWTFGPWRRD